MHEEPRFQQREAKAYLAIRCEVTDGVPAVVDVAFPELFGWLGSHGIKPAGPPLIRTRVVDSDGEPLVLDVGVPFGSGAEGVDGDERVCPEVLPSGRYVTLLHVGPYRSETVADLATSREILMDWVRERGIVISHESPRGRSVACGVDDFQVGPDSEADPSKWRTELAYFVVEDR